MSNLITVKYTDQSPGHPYFPSIRGTALYKSEIPVQGKTYYLKSFGNGCSRTWISDDEARKFLLNT